MKTQVGMWIDHRKQTSFSFRQPGKGHGRSNQMSKSSFGARAIHHRTNAMKRRWYRPLTGGNEDTWATSLTTTRRFFYLLMVLTPSLSLALAKRKGNYANNSRSGILAKKLWALRPQTR